MPEKQSKTLSMIDLFSGCGGLSLGFEYEGFTPLLFSEINLNAAQTYLANRKQHDIIPFGDVYSLTNDNLRVITELWKSKGIDDVDIVCGGPPCQGYSGIGHRRSFDLEKTEIPSNHLFLEMVRIIEFVRPKCFLFENVKGLLSGRWTKDGTKGEIFKDVLKAFQGIDGYEVEWQLVYAKNYGVPQNRPRVLIIGYRSDVLEKNRNPELALCEEPSPYLHNGMAIEKGFLPVGDITPPSIEDSLSDLMDPTFQYGSSTETYPSASRNETQDFFRTNLDGKKAKKGTVVTEHEYSNHSPRVIEKFSFMLRNNGNIPEHLKTKKFAQRVLPQKWGDDGPNITATSLPDDYVHYAQARTPTVREWARIQTFPDWYQFAGPRTTGGRRRAGDPDKGDWSRDVPKYTQIGNAVPVLLARSLSKHIKTIIS